MSVTQEQQPLTNSSESEANIRNSRNKNELSKELKYWQSKIEQYNPNNQDIKTELEFESISQASHHNKIQLESKSIQINLHIKKIQLNVPAQLKVKLVWLRGSKKLETKKKAIVDPKNPVVLFNETMSLITRFNPDSNDPTKYKKKKCYMQLVAITKGKNKPVGILQFNLSDFINVPPNTLIKLTFAKWFDKKAAIMLTTSLTAQDNNLDHLETESSATVESISDTFSEYSMGTQSFNYGSNKNVIKSSFATCEETSIGSHYNNSRSQSFCSNFVDEASPRPYIINQSDLSKKDLEIQKLKNEVERYKSWLSEFAQKQEMFQNTKDELEQVKEQFKVTNDKLKQIEKNYSEVINQLKEAETINHKMRIKIDYLTNKWFKLSCKLDKADYTPDKNKEDTDIEMLLDILKKKQAEYWNLDEKQPEDPTDFIFNIFSHFEQMKHVLVETKIKWAESEGEKERLSNQINNLQSKLKRYSKGSQRSSIDHKSQTSQNENTPEKQQPYMVPSLSSRYLPSFSFFSRGGS